MSVALNWIPVMPSSMDVVMNSNIPTLGHGWMGPKEAKTGEGKQHSANSGGSTDKRNKRLTGEHGRPLMSSRLLI